MKKIIFYSLLLSGLLAIPNKSDAQLLHVKGVKGVFSEAFLEKKGFGVGAGYYNIFSNKLFYRTVAEYHSSTFSNTQTQIANGYFELGYTPFAIKQQFYISFLVGAGIGAEFLNDKVLNKKEVNPILLEGVGLMLEYCPSSRITTALLFNQRFLQFNKNGDALYVIGLSIQYNLN